MNNQLKKEKSNIDAEIRKGSFKNIIKFLCNYIFVLEIILLTISFGASLHILTFSIFASFIKFLHLL